MSNYETLIGLLVSAIGSLFVAAQVMLARRQMRDNLTLAEHEADRLKRQATIDFYMTTMEKVLTWRSTLPDDWDKPGIRAYTTSAYEHKDKDRLLTIASYLAYFEALAVAVRSRIYDLETLDLMAGSRVVDIADNYAEFFINRREEVGSDMAYRNLEWLAAQIQELRGKPDYKGTAHKRLPGSTS